MKLEVKKKEQFQNWKKKKKKEEEIEINLTNSKNEEDRRKWEDKEEILKKIRKNGKNYVKNIQDFKR